jgi:hypothetical protein
MQCKDIPDRPILELLSKLDRWGHWFSQESAPDSWYAIVSKAMPPGIPGKLALAKMRMLMRRRLVDGCACGCRGDFVLTNKGREFLKAIEEKEEAEDCPEWPNRYDSENFFGDEE